MDLPDKTRPIDMPEPRDRKPRSPVEDPVNLPLRDDPQVPSPNKPVEAPTDPDLEKKKQIIVEGP